MITTKKLNLEKFQLQFKKGAKEMLSIIVAKAKNNVIGKDNSMLWKLPDDLKRFKDFSLLEVMTETIL